MWIKKENRTYKITEVNTVLKGEKSELWVKKEDTSTFRILKGPEEVVLEYKDAIDYAIQNEVNLFEI